MRSLSKNIKIIPTLLLIVVLVIFIQQPGNAADFTPRSVSLSTSVPSAQAVHTFNFTYPSLSLIGSMSFEYCTNSPLEYIPCVAPAGLDVTAGALSSQIGITGFTFDAVNTTANRIVITRAPVMTSVLPTSYVFTNITNPSTPGQTVFVRIASYATADGTGGYTDKGTVAFAVNAAFSIGVYVPPYLTFCAGVTVATNCTTATGNIINLNELQTTVPAAATTQLSAATNDPSGLVIYVSGATMTSGNNVIPALATNAGSSTGTSQFGINMRGNASPVVGTDPDGAGTIAPTASYNIPNSYRYVSGEAIASSPISTDFKRLTVSYVVNVSASQPAGLYAATMTYTAVAAF